MSLTTHLWLCMGPGHCRNQMILTWWWLSLWNKTKSQATRTPKEIRLSDMEMRWKHMRKWFSCHDVILWAKKSLLFPGSFPRVLVGSFNMVRWMKLRKSWRTLHSRMINRNPTWNFLRYLQCVSYLYKQFGCFLFYFSYTEGLMQKRCNSSALTIELLLSCTNPSISPVLVDPHDLVTYFPQGCFTATGSLCHCSNPIT